MGDWGIIEAQLGMRLPRDYREMIEHYGTRTFADFLNPINPFLKPESFLARLDDMILQHERGMHAEFPEYFPLPIYPEPGGLFPWATTDDGDTLYWLTDVLPQDWPLVVWKSRGPKHVVYPFGATEFLQRWLSGALECPVFPRRHEYFDPGFTQPRSLELATVYFWHVATPFDERFSVLMGYLGAKKIKHRHVIQCDFLVDPSESRMTYTDIGHYGSWLSMAFPGGDEDHFRRLIGLVPVPVGLAHPFRVEEHGTDLARCPAGLGPEGHQVIERRSPGWSPSR